MLVSPSGTPQFVEDIVVVMQVTVLTPLISLVLIMRNLVCNGEE